MVLLAELLWPAEEHSCPNQLPIPERPVVDLEAGTAAVEHEFYVIGRRR